MQPQVVRLSESDLALAARLSESMLDEPPAPEDRLMELLSDRRNIVLACLVDDVPVGYLIAHRFPSLSGERLVYLFDIEVASDRRQKGIGRALTEFLIALCRAEGVDGIWVGSASDNLAACRLWERTGAARESESFVEFTYEL